MLFFLLVFSCWALRPISVAFHILLYSQRENFVFSCHFFWLVYNNHNWTRQHITLEMPLLLIKSPGAPPNIYPFQLLYIFLFHHLWRGRHCAGGLIICWWPSKKLNNCYHIYSWAINCCWLDFIQVHLFFSSIFESFWASSFFNFEKNYWSIMTAAVMNNTKLLWINYMRW